MTVLLECAAFAFGVYLAIRVIAALYGIIDVWHMIGKAWPRAVADIAIWIAVTAIVTYVIHGAFRSALIWGLSTYFGIYLGMWPLARQYFEKRRTDRKTDSPPH